MIVFVDEIEKAFAGTGTDMSGVKTEMTGTMLSWMQDRGADGTDLYRSARRREKRDREGGRCDGGNSDRGLRPFGDAEFAGRWIGGAIARSAAGRGRYLTGTQPVDRDLQLDHEPAAGTSPALHSGYVLLRPALAQERKAIWDIYLEKWSLSGELPDDEGWTGAEIKECCRKAWRLKLSLQESAEYIVPVSRSAADQIEALRRQASGRFLSAAQPGVFTPSLVRYLSPSESGHSATENRNLNIGTMRSGDRAASFTRRKSLPSRNPFSRECTPQHVATVPTDLQGSPAYPSTIPGG